MTTTPAAPLIKAVKAALCDGITGLAEYTGFTPNAVTCEWGHPLGKLGDTAAWVGDWISTQAWKSIGDRQREISQGSFEFYVYAIRQGATAEEVEAVVYDLVEPVERWLRANVTAGLDLADFPGCKHFRLSLTRFDMLAGAGDQARDVVANCSIDMYARI